MTEICVKREKQVVIVPKSAFKEGGRNPLQTLFKDAGYDKIDGNFDRQDQIIQGDFIFRGIKGSKALATQFDLFRQKSVGIIMGSDVVSDADFLCEDSYEVQTQITRLLTLGIGKCSLNFLAPEDENPIRSAADLEGRRIFTKYPSTLRRLLQELGINAQIRETEGADTRVNEFRNEDANVAAFEIVGSGDTARKNRLQIVKNELVYPIFNTVNPEQVQTDLFLTNKDSLSNFTKESLQELGLALESAMNDGVYASIRFNAPNIALDRFRNFGMKGPTVSPLLSREDEGQRWSALEIFVPEDVANSTRLQILRLGGKDVGIERGVRVDMPVDQSEVLKVLPLDFAYPNRGEDDWKKVAPVQPIIS